MSKGVMRRNGDIDVAHTSIHYSPDVPKPLISAAARGLRPERTNLRSVVPSLAELPSDSLRLMYFNRDFVP